MKLTSAEALIRTVNAVAGASLEAWARWIRVEA
jgi:hypothetical protein